MLELGDYLGRPKDHKVMYCFRWEHEGIIRNPHEAFRIKGDSQNCRNGCRKYLTEYVRIGSLSSLLGEVAISRFAS